MKTSRTILTLATMGVLASFASAQNYSGSVDLLANVSGGSTINRAYSVLPKGKSEVAMRLDNAGPGVTAFGEAYAGPGILFARRDVSSIHTPYGQSWGKATYQDSVRWNGTSPITVRVRAQLVGDLWVGGTNPLQTDASAYANFIFFAGNVNYNQTLQRTKTVEGTWDTTRGAIGDITVTLQPGRWYTFNNTLQVNGDASDSTREYTPTFSRGAYGLKIWFEPTPGSPLGTLQSASGHDYSIEPILPAVQ